MRLIEALKLAQHSGADESRRLRVFLACGFTPLHLQTFLTAHLRVALPGVRPEIRTGLFGDLIGNLERSNPSDVDVLAIALEWFDLDPRLGIRGLGGWRLADVTDILICAKMNAARLQRAIENAAKAMSVVISLPGLPLPPAFATRRIQCGNEELHLHLTVAQLAEAVSTIPGVRILSQQELSSVSAIQERYDVKSDLQSGFPYTIIHASELGRLLACLIENRPPAKGLITDLDGTLWSGIVGEDGIDQVSWSLDSHSQIHGVYQQFLSSIASTGALVGVASKNNPDIVAQVFERRDLLLKKDEVFPFEVHWSNKSESVQRILNQWNVGADAVVFVDDSPAEIAEVQAAFPELICRVFPKNNPAGVWSLLGELRERFGKSVVSEEDILRRKSIRDAEASRKNIAASEVSLDEFLRSAEARIYFECSRAADDLRAFELVNKTNQFNLNGRRYIESEWRNALADPSAFLLTAIYEDKYGALGKIAVLLGTRHPEGVRVHTWVMSCRAFSRYIEHQCLRYLFEELGTERIDFDYEPTQRNSPMQEFLQSIVGGRLSAPVSMSKEVYYARPVPLFHRVEVGVHV